MDTMWFPWGRNSICTQYFERRVLRPATSKLVFLVFHCIKANSEMLPKFQSLLYDSTVPVATEWFPRSSHYCTLPKFQWLLYDSQIPVATVWFPSSSCYCMIPKFQSLLQASQVPVATVWFPSSSRYCMIPKFQSLLQASKVPVTTVWFPSSSPYCRLPKFQSLLYDSHLKFVLSQRFALFSEQRPNSATPSKTRSLWKKIFSVRCWRKLWRLKYEEARRIYGDQCKG